MDTKSLLLQAAALLQQAHIKAIAAKSNAVEEISDARDCVEAALVWFGGEAAPRQNEECTVALVPVDDSWLDAFISAVVPGGDVCDPQSVADAIRHYFSPNAKGEAQPPAKIL